LIKRTLRTLHAQPGLRRFKVIDFDHRSESFRFEVPSINQHPSTALVPAGERDGDGQLLVGDAA
jgi:hypothetical protein